MFLCYKPSLHMHRVPHWCLYVYGCPFFHWTDLHLLLVDLMLDFVCFCYLCAECNFTISLNQSSCKLLLKWEVLPLFFAVHLSATWQAKRGSLTTLCRWTVVQQFDKKGYLIVCSGAKAFFYVLTEDFSIHVFFRQDGLRNQCTSQVTVFGTMEMFQWIPF